MIAHLPKLTLIGALLSAIEPGSERVKIPALLEYAMFDNDAVELMRV